MRSQSVAPIVGDAGGATAGPGSPVKVRAIVLSYSGSAGGTVVTFADKTRTFLTVTGNTSGVFYPTEVVHNNAGAAVAGTESPSRCHPIAHGTITVTVAAGAGAGSTVNASIIYED